MNAVEIEEAVSALAIEPFNPDEFLFQFLAAFGAKETTVKRLRRGESNASDVPGGVLWRGNIHLAVAAAGEVSAKLAALRASPKTAPAKAKFILATDGETVEAEDVSSGEAIAAPFADMARQFGFFLPLAGISTVQEIKNNPIDIKAVGRLNKLYVELLKTNPDWQSSEKRPALNRLMARLIFCFFAEDTGIFHGSYQFTPTVDRMSDAQSTNTHEVIGELFRAMGTKPEERATAGFRTWADGFPYVNGGLFAGDGDCPRFSKLARAYLISAGSLDWKEINPDIFGSMIQAVADEDERGELGMHYTSVPNILKVLNPLFLDSLREQLEAAGESKPKLRNLRRRLSTIRVFDPACGSGNFLVIAYKKMREIEAEAVRRLGGEERRSIIRLSNFYGIEIKSFAAEIARLALLIAEFQADCLYLSQQEARAMVLPLHRTGQITVGNALREDWLAVCPPVAKTVVAEEDLAGPTGRLALEENRLGERAEAETYICGNPPYAGATITARKGATEEEQKRAQAESERRKQDLEAIFAPRAKTWKTLDYVSGWFMKAADYGAVTHTATVFVSTNSVCQGQQVPVLWPMIYASKHRIAFAHTSFKWTNLASRKAAVTVAIISIAINCGASKQLFSLSDGGEPVLQEVDNINAYLVPRADVIVQPTLSPPDDRSEIIAGGKPVEGGHLFLTAAERHQLLVDAPDAEVFCKRVLGANEHNKGIVRYTLWVRESEHHNAFKIRQLQQRFELVSAARRASPKAETISSARHGYRFQEVKQVGSERVTIIPKLTSEQRQFIPAGLEPPGTIITDLAFAQLNGKFYEIALLNSRLHFIWVATVCGKFKADYCYSNTLGWNTFPIPKLIESARADLTRCAEDILLAREAHFPATIADLYDPDAMPDNLRAAHEANDETLERIYIGRRFRNDTERLEHLFERYARMTADQPTKKAKKAA